MSHPFNVKYLIYSITEMYCSHATCFISPSIPKISSKILAVTKSSETSVIIPIGFTDGYRLVNHSFCAVYAKSNFNESFSKLYIGLLPFLIKTTFSRLLYHLTNLKSSWNHSSWLKQLLQPVNAHCKQSFF